MSAIDPTLERTAHIENFDLRHRGTPFGLRQMDSGHIEIWRGPDDHIAQSRRTTRGLVQAFLAFTNRFACPTRRESRPALRPVALRGRKAENRGRGT